jgi:uncharacterized membrane protein
LTKFEKNSQNVGKSVNLDPNLGHLWNFSQFFAIFFNSLFCVPAKVTKLIGLRILLFLSPINLVTFAGTQNNELKNMASNFVNFSLFVLFFKNSEISTINLGHYPGLF